MRIDTCYLWCEWALNAVMCAECIIIHCQWFYTSTDNLLPVIFKFPVSYFIGCIFSPVAWCHSPTLWCCDLLIPWRDVVWPSPVPYSLLYQCASALLLCSFVLIHPLLPGFPSIRFVILGGEYKPHFYNTTGRIISYTKLHFYNLLVLISCTSCLSYYVTKTRTYSACSSQYFHTIGADVNGCNRALML